MMEGLPVAVHLFLSDILLPPVGLLQAEGWWGE